MKTALTWLGGIVIVGVMFAAAFGESDEEKALRQEQYQNAQAEQAGLAAAEAERKAAEEAQKEAACYADIDCIVPEIRVDAFAKCRAPIESLAFLDYEWTSGFTRPAFPAWRWGNKEAGIVTFMGDEIKFQAPNGTWMRHRYFCDFDIRTKEPVEVRSEPGRFNFY